MLSVHFTLVSIHLIKVATNLTRENKITFRLHNRTAKSVSSGLVTETSDSNAVTFTEPGTATT
jgi:hypothetical protein